METSIRTSGPILQPAETKFLAAIEQLVSRLARDAIFPATVVGKPRQEDFFIGDMLQELLSPLFPLVMPV